MAKTNVYKVNNDKSYIIMPITITPGEYSFDNATKDVSDQIKKGLDAGIYGTSEGINELLSKVKKVYNGEPAAPNLKADVDDDIIVYDYDGNSVKIPLVTWEWKFPYLENFIYNMGSNIFNITLNNDDIDKNNFTIE